MVLICSIIVTATSFFAFDAYVHFVLGCVLIFTSHSLVDTGTILVLLWGRLTTPTVFPYTDNGGQYWHRCKGLYTYNMYDIIIFRFDNYVEHDRYFNFGHIFGPSTSRCLACFDIGPKIKSGMTKKNWAYFSSYFVTSTLNGHNFGTKKYNIVNHIPMERSWNEL